MTTKIDVNSVKLSERTVTLKVDITVPRDTMMGALNFCEDQLVPIVNTAIGQTSVPDFQEEEGKGGGTEMKSDADRAEREINEQKQRAASVE